MGEGELVSAWNPKTLCCRLHDCALPFTQTTAALRLNIKNQDSFYELIGGKGQQSLPVSKLTGVC